jgi:PncC family amidohydrolase
MRINNQELSELFLASGMTLALAESCTGGMIASRITDIPGCSSWFRGGVVAYHNDIKEKLLGVTSDNLQRYGAVSEQVARSMAEGAIVSLDSDIALAVTGIAGPDGGTAEKPVGTVFIAVADRYACIVEKYYFEGSREMIRQNTAEEAFFLLKKRLLQSEYA